MPDPKQGGQRGDHLQIVGWDVRGQHPQRGPGDRDGDRMTAPRVLPPAPPQGAMYAQHLTLGRVWVRSFNTQSRTALVEVGGNRRRAVAVALAALDFTRPVDVTEGGRR